MVDLDRDFVVRLAGDDGSTREGSIKCSGVKLWFDGPLPGVSRNRADVCVSGLALTASMVLPGYNKRFKESADQRTAILSTTPGGGSDFLIP